MISARGPPSPAPIRPTRCRGMVLRQTTDDRASVEQIIMSNSKKSFVQMPAYKLPVEQKITLSRTVVHDMTNNPLFTDVPISLVVLGRSTEDLSALQLTLDESKRLVAQGASDVKLKSLEVTTMLTDLAHYVQIKSNGDPAVIQRSGMPLRKSPAPIGLLPPPPDLKAATAGNTGQVTLSWKKVKGARGYRVEQCADPANEGGFHLVDTAMKTRFVVTGLSTGAKLWFRVMTVSAAGRGIPSASQAAVVPLRDSREGGAAPRACSQERPGAAPPADPSPRGEGRAAGEPSGDSFFARGVEMTRSIFCERPRRWRCRSRRWSRRARQVVTFRCDCPGRGGRNAAARTRSPLTGEGDLLAYPRK